MSSGLPSLGAVAYVTTKTDALRSGNIAIISWSVRRLLRREDTF
ncbi:hypothetical protein AS9A_2763 [Hoyosella subflava DQS3-9A1]|uniref:Uncharacterized protein n=1 Tax=Hoyosella subflava (strain DSM 45089 / JCM 17490 / NBRC 109087 / DQS3-9A1) TaxID=443218 RepID=F6EIA3_HOYSD|nr:hypothetical protein AS9A_2763 [Hoyosella subflava DQS3-9A1]